MDDSKLQGYTHWVAQYGKSCEYTGTIGIWQYSSKGKVAGINGNVDLDMCYIDFPKIIKEKGFNGYSKKVEETHEKTLEERVADLEERVARLEGK